MPESGMAGGVMSRWTVNRGLETGMDMLEARERLLSRVVVMLKSLLLYTVLTYSSHFGSGIVGKRKAVWTH